MADLSHQSKLGGARSWASEEVLPRDHAAWAADRADGVRDGEHDNRVTRAPEDVAKLVAMLWNGDRLSLYDGKVDLERIGAAGGTAEHPRYLFVRGQIRDLSWFPSWFDLQESSLLHVIYTRPEHAQLFISKYKSGGAPPWLYFKGCVGVFHEIPNSRWGDLIQFAQGTPYDGMAATPLLKSKYGGWREHWFHAFIERAKEKGIRTVCLRTDPRGGKRTEEIFMTKAIESGYSPAQKQGQYRQAFLSMPE